jgi:hypothetical protein
MKKLLLFILSATAGITVFSQSAGPKNGGTFRNTPFNGSSQSWINAANAGASDNIYATFGNITGGVGSYTDYLVAANFGFSIPGNAQITGIKVGIERSDVSIRTADYSIRIVKGGSITGADHSTGEYYSSGVELEIKDVNNNFGNDGDLWDETWTPAAINDPGFGVAVSAQRIADGGMTDGRIDNIRITVYYVVNITLPVKLINFSAMLRDDKTRISWTTAEESEMDRFEVQRSVDGTTFNSFGTLICSNQRIATDYSFTDYSPAHGTSYYRLKMLEKDGKISYSKVVTVQFNTDNTTTLYPSPWKKGEALFIRNPGNQKLNIQFYNNAGEIITRLAVLSNQVPLENLSNVKGILRYKVLNEKNTVTGSGTLMVY